MKRKNIEKLLSDICEKLKQVSGQAAMTIINTLLNLVETLLEENESKSKEIQKLQDEVNLLKGEQGKPDINKESKNKKNNTNHSSENERKKRTSAKPRKPGGTNKSKVTVDRVVELQIDLSTLPHGTERHGIKSTVLQDINFSTDNVEFKRQTYYNKATKQWFIAPLPDGGS